MNDSRLDVRPLGKGKNRPENVLEFHPPANHDSRDLKLPPGFEEGRDCWIAGNFRLARYPGYSTAR